MNKKLLTTAIAAALAGGMSAAATADVRLGGRIDVSVDSYDFDGGYDDINMNSNTTYFFIDGSEDLGNGLKGIFRASFGFCADTTGGYGGGYGGFINSPECYDGGEGSTLYDRDQYVGLAGGFGTVRLGSIFTPWYEHGAAIDPLFGTSLQGRNGGMQSYGTVGSGYGPHSESGSEYGDHGIVTQAVRYDSPSFGGFSGSGFYSFDSNDSDGRDDDAYGLSAQFETDNILAYADYHNGNWDGDDTAWKIGGKFTMDNFGIYAQFEDDGGLIWNEDAQWWTLGGSFTMGNTMLYLAYGATDDGSDDADAWTLAARHSLSSRTSVYAGWNQVDWDCTGCGERDHIAIGVSHTF